MKTTLERIIAMIEGHTDLTRKEIECLTLDEIDNLVDVIRKAMIATNELEFTIKKIRKNIDK